jgi:hypothetical protein
VGMGSITREDAPVVCCVYELFGIISRMMSATYKFIYCNLVNLKNDAGIQIVLPTFVMRPKSKGVSISQFESEHTDRRHTSLPINKLPSLSLALLFREV